MYLVTPMNPKFNILLYGPPGVGKTWLASTAQDHSEMADVVFLNVEGGLITIAGRRDIKAVNIIAIDPFKSTPQLPTMPENCSTLEDEFWKLANKKEEYANIRTVVIDSGSECQTLNLECIVNAAVSGNKATPGKKSRGRDDIYLEDYGKSSAQLKRLFRWFRDLDINCIITALPAYIFQKGPDNKTVGTEPIEVRPQFTDKLAKSVMGYMDFVWYVYEDAQGQRHLLTQKTGIFQAKTRGINFAKAIGKDVLIKDPTDPNHKGMTLADLYNIYIESEGRGD